VTRVRSQLLESVHCTSSTNLTAGEAAQLRVFSADIPALGAALPCEITAGHDGSHIALATLSDGDQLWWWLCWASQLREIRQIDLCDGRDLDDPYLDECLLPLGHPGTHSYEIPGPFFVLPG
jgi:hypothetical protein